MTIARAILVTHSHPDHVGALAEMRRRLRVPVMAHAGRSGRKEVRADGHLLAGQRVPLGDDQVTVFYSRYLARYISIDKSMRRLSPSGGIAGP